MAYVLGIDLGTSSLKGLLVNPEGEIVYETSTDYPTLSPQAGYSEQDPQVWLDAMDIVLSRLVADVPDAKEQLAGISISGQMHSLVLLDEQRRALRNAILWNDVRTTTQCQQIIETLGEDLLEITMNTALEGFTLPKILWVQEHEPDIWAATKGFQLPKDYLRLWLTGEYHMDLSDAAGTLLLDVEKAEWSPLIAERFNLEIEQFPILVDSVGQTGVVKAGLAARYGFVQPVKVFAGGADNACAAVGAGVVKADIGMSSIGTSGVFLSMEDTAQKDYQGRLHLFNHAVPQQYYSMGVTLSAGNSLNWFKRTFAKALSFDELLAGIDEIPAGSEGLLFSPYITGERTPHNDANIRGSFIGMDVRHELGHFTRSVLEGITFSLKDSFNLMQSVANKEFSTIVSVGGGAKNRTWLQIQADVFNTPISVLKSEQGPGLGAAMLAAVGLGWFENLEACSERFVEVAEVIQPNRENVAIYEAAYARYQRIYAASKEVLMA